MVIASLTVKNKINQINLNNLFFIIISTNHSRSKNGKFFAQILRLILIYEYQVKTEYQSFHSYTFIQKSDTIRHI